VFGFLGCSGNGAKDSRPGKSLYAGPIVCLKQGFGRSFQEVRRAVVSRFLFSCELESAAKPIGFIHLLDRLVILPVSATNPGRRHAAHLTGLSVA
jgi:hypothetical protein